MRPALRTAAFFTTASLALLIAISAAALLAVFLTVPATAEKLAGLPDHPWWFVYEPAPQPDTGNGNSPSPLWSIAAGLAAAAIALPAVFRIRALSARTSKPIALLFSVLLLSLCAEGLRAAAAYLVATDSSITAVVVLTRAVYGARFLGLLSLVAMGLYALDMKYARHFVLVAAAVALAFAVAVSIPVDRTVFLAQLTCKLGDEQALWFASLVLSVIVVAAGAGAAIVRRHGQTLLALGGSVLLLGGREILFFATRPSSAAMGTLLLAGGVTLWLRALGAMTVSAGEKGTGRAGKR